MDAAFTASGIVLPPAEADEVMQTRFSASMQIGDETTATRAWERGRQLSVQQAIAFALADVLPREDDEGPS